MRLYVVIQEPHEDHAMQTLVWFVEAGNKAQAVRYFEQLCPEAASNDDSGWRQRLYKKPTAQPVTTGGNALRV